MMHVAFARTRLGLCGIARRARERDSVVYKSSTLSFEPLLQHCEETKVGAREGGGQVVVHGKGASDEGRLSRARSGHTRATRLRLRPPTASPAAAPSISLMGQKSVSIIILSRNSLSRARTLVYSKVSWSEGL